MKDPGHMNENAGEGHRGSSPRQITPAESGQEAAYVLSEASRKFIEYTHKTIDYQYIVDVMRTISGASIVALNRFEDDGKDFTTVAVSGQAKMISKGARLMGFQLAGKRWKHDPRREEKIRYGKTTRFRSLSELADGALARNLVAIIEKVFQTGECVIVKSSKGNLTIGDFTLIYTRTSAFAHQSRIEVYADMVGMLFNRLKTEKALQKNEKQLEMFFSQSLHGFFMCMLDEPIIWDDHTDKDKALEYVMDHQRMTRVNQAMLDQYGAKEEDFIGITVRELFKHDLEHAREIWRGLFDRGSWHVETLEQKMDGSPMIIDGDYICLHDDDGRITGHFGVQVDVSRKKAQEEQTLFQGTIVENISEAVIATDPDFRIKYVNRATRLLYGYSDEELIGQSPLIFVADPHEETMLDDLFKTVASGDSYEVEMIHRRKDGSHFHCEIKVVPVLGPHGDVQAYVGIHKDITERKRAEAGIREARDRAEAANRAKSDFLASMSHEIRTPLNGVIGFTQLLRNTSLSEMQRQYLENANISAHMLLAVINDILDFSKIEAGKLELDIVRADVVELCGQAIDILNLNATEKGLEMLLNIQPGIPSQAMIDPVRLKQILVNLLGNAVKFTEQGEVELRLEYSPSGDQKGTYHFAVRDTGIGIEKEKQAEIFSPFYQAGTSTTRKYGGTGLGLQISRHLVDKMGGEIGFSSEAGRGSTFHFSFEANVDDGYKQQPPDIPGIRSALLLAEKGKSRDILQNTLSARNIRCHCIDALPSPSEMRSLKNMSFDVIMADQCLQGAKGLDALRQIRHEFEASGAMVPSFILLHKAVSEPGLAESCDKLRVRARLVKPLKPDVLVRLLGEIGQDALREGPAEIAHEEKPEDRLSQMDAPVILIVEDVQINRLLIKTLINRFLPQAVILEAVNGEEAINVHQRDKQLDLVLMDIQMPVMNGLDATSRIRGMEKDSGRHTPIVALTAGVVKGEKEKCLEAGMDDFLSKPINQELLREILRKYTGLSKS